MTSQPTPGPESIEHDAALRGLEETFGSLVKSFRQQMAALAEATSPGLLPGTLKVLTTVEQHGPLTVSALVEHLAIDKGQASRAISELEALGFVERTEAVDDRRIRILATTPLAADRLSEARHTVQHRMGAHIRSWPVESITHLDALLRALTDGTPPPNP